MLKILALIFVTALPAAVAAATPQEQIIAQLAAQGFVDIEIYRTLLGRTRIVAESELYHREIVFNPNTGEILRDYIVALDDGNKSGAPIVPQLLDPAGGSGDIGAGDDDNTDDEGDDDSGGSSSDVEEDQEDAEDAEDAEDEEDSEDEEDEEDEVDEEDEEDD